MSDSNSAEVVGSSLVPQGHFRGVNISVLIGFGGRREVRGLPGLSVVRRDGQTNLLTHFKAPIGLRKWALIWEKGDPWEQAKGYKFHLRSSNRKKDNIWRFKGIVVWEKDLPVVNSSFEVCASRPSQSEMPFEDVVLRYQNQYVLKANIRRVHMKLIKRDRVT